VEQALMERMVLSNLATKKAASLREAALAQLPAILLPAATIIQQLWTTKVWSSRASLLLRLRTFSEQHRLSHLPLGVQAAAFISSLQRIKQSTMKQYASGLSSTLSRLGHQTPMLDLLRSALSASGSTIPTRQAPPASVLQVFVLVNAALRAGSDRLAVGLFLCWKTASRWDDVHHLRKESFLLLTPRRIIIAWGATKSNRRQAFRPDSWTVVDEPDPSRAWMMELCLRTIAALRPEQLLLESFTTDKVRKLMRQQTATAELTAHSIKRGAINVLIAAAVEGRLRDPRLIPLLAKHKDALHWFPQTTLGYVDDKVQLALMLGTQHATMLL
jgi:hypothetical protein